MIVSDNNALNSYLKTPPYFGGERGVTPLFEIAPPRPVPGVIQERQTEHEARWAEGRRREELPDRQRAAEASAARALARAGARQSAGDAALPDLRLARPGEREIDPRLSSQAQIRTRLAHSGYLPRQLVIAGGHAFDSATQARATLNASKVHHQRRLAAQRGGSRQAHAD